MKQNLNNIKKTGFKTPENYFDSLEDQIMNTIKTNHTLGNIEDTGFKIPNEYIDNVEDAVFSKLRLEEKTKVVSLFSKRNLMYVSGLAATMLIFFSIFMNSNEETIETIDIELVENYIIDEDIDSYEIAALLTNEDLSEDFLVESNIMDESLETYILENISIEDLLIE